jgi:hypothetical protein
MTKKEKKMLKAAAKLEKATKKYLKELTSIDKKFQKLPTSLTRAYMLEEYYFNIIERVMRNTVDLELLHTRLYESLNEDEYIPF